MTVTSTCIEFLRFTFENFCKNCFNIFTIFMKIIIFMIFMFFINFDENWCQVCQIWTCIPGPSRTCHDHVRLTSRSCPDTVFINFHQNLSFSSIHENDEIWQVPTCKFNVNFHFPLLYTVHTSQICQNLVSRNDRILSSWQQNLSIRPYFTLCMLSRTDSGSIPEPVW